MTLDPKRITSRIFQGGWILAHDIPALSRLGITHLLNLDLPYEDPEPFEKANFKLKTMSLVDNCLMLPQQARDIMAHIDRILSVPDHKIYIHCVEGVSRSVTISWLYLIHTGLSEEEASQRVRPNPLLYNGFIVDALAGSR